MNVLIPTTLPSMSTNGRRCFRIDRRIGLMYTIGLFGSGCRATELITPIVIVFCSPSGLPIANTSCPCRTRRGFQR
jgi:hypothetical protein